MSVALTAGVFVYQYLVVFPNGHFAAIAVPKAYFLWFGKARQQLALAVVQFATALPVSILVSGAVLAICRACRDRSVPFLVAILVGMLLCYSYGALGILLFVPSGLPPDVKPYPITVMVRQLLLPPWWALSTVGAPWLGIAFAAWLLRRRGKAEPTVQADSPRQATGSVRRRSSPADEV